MRRLAVVSNCRTSKQDLAAALIHIFEIPVVRYSFTEARPRGSEHGRIFSAASCCTTEI